MDTIEIPEPATRHHREQRGPGSAPHRLVEGSETMSAAAWDDRQRRIERLAQSCEECARELVKDGGRTTPGSVNDGLARTGLPHLRADADLFGPGHARDDLIDLSRLIERIGILVGHLERPRADHRLRSGAALLMNEAAALLRRHLEHDRGSWVEMRRVLADGELTARLDAAETMERRAGRDLRFVWQPPVPATAATALRHNPGANRVLVLGGEHLGGDRP